MTTYQRLTAKGQGAIAVIAIVGDDAIKVLGACFTPVGKKSFQENNQGLTYGHWNSTGEDLLVVKSAIAGSTEVRYEIQCHGSEAAVAAIIADVAAHGTNEALAAQSPPLTAARFRSDIEQLLNAATTRRTAELLLHQLHISPDALEQLAKQAGQGGAAEIETLLRWSHFGTRFHQRQSIVLCGRPNAGKSSLINAILGFERAIVTPIAGTTRDVLSHQAVIDGWPVELSDTAGLRSGGGQIEKIGIAKAKKQIEHADLIIAVTDATDDAPWDQEFQPHIWVVNKTDLISDDALPTPVVPAIPASPAGPAIPVVPISATTNTGITDLLTMISQILFPTLPPADQPLLLTSNQVADFKALL